MGVKAATANNSEALHGDADSVASGWYVKRQSIVKGPLSAAAIKRNVALGRIKPGDLLSTDAGVWTRLDETPAFSAATSRVAGDRMRICQDERQAERRRAPPEQPAPGTEQRHEHDRRQPEPSRIVRRRAQANRVWSGLRRQAPDSRAPMIVAAVMLACFGVVTIYLGRPGVGQQADCAAPANPGVNWDFCQKVEAVLRQADLRGLSARNANFSNADFAGANLAGTDGAYTNFSGANFELADLSSARLIGADLRRTNLAYADLTGANLKFADLTGAKLGGAALTGADFSEARWFDGQTCGRGSIGKCGSDRP
jgi:hypothetical protein